MAGSSLTPAEVASIRAEQTADHYRRLWLAEQEEPERTWTPQEIVEARAAAMVEHYRRLWEEGRLDG